MIKLNKTQVDAIASKIYNELFKEFRVNNDAIKKETRTDFLKTDVGKAITKVNNAFFNSKPITEGTITQLALEYYEIKLHSTPYMHDIANDIVLASIESNDLNALIETIKAKYNVQENDAA
jgi:hypothetical protein